jgi:F-type H+-transporting ATPase subunit a
MRLSSDALVFWQYGFFKLNGTIVTTWAIMALLVLGARLLTRSIVGNGAASTSRRQAVLEIIVSGLRSQIREVGLAQADTYIAFLGTLFLFLVTVNLLTILPFYEPPTGSLSTTTALALCVFVAVPLYGIRSQGLLGYLKSYLKPTIIMLPFNIIGELSRTLALAVRLFGNMMSGSMVVAILLTITPFFFPVVMNLLGLLTGMVQAYIFTILAAVFIAAGTKTNET